MAEYYHLSKVSFAIDYVLYLVLTIENMKYIVICKNLMIISCKSRESPENPPGKSPAVLAKQRKFHAYNIDANVIIKSLNT